MTNSLFRLSSPIRLLTILSIIVLVAGATQARWRALEDEARRAGVLPGWLRE